MQPHKDAERTARYRREASACAAAALATVIAEVKQAYLELEQGWLSLAPKGDGSRAGAIDAVTGHEHAQPWKDGNDVGDSPPGAK